MSFGRIEIFRDVPSHLEGFSRTVRVFTPASYQRSSRQRHGVLFMQDGQNVFEHPESARFPTWGADRALAQLIESGQLGPWMIVAIDHGLGRFEDYSPWPEPRAQVMGRGQVYARFLVEQLMPWVAARYRVRTEPRSTAVMGSSLGGLVSLYLAWRFPHVFGRVGAMSPSVMWSEDELFRRWQTALPRTRIYLDAGTEEQFHLGSFPMAYGERTAQFGQHLRSLGHRETELKVVLEPGGQHEEAAWARRLPGALSWLLWE